MNKPMKNQATPHISLRSRKSREVAARRRAQQASRLAKRRSRPRRDPNPGLRRFALCLFVVELALLLFANPFLRVTKVRVDGAQTVSTQQVFDEARVPAHVNIFWLALREKFGPRLQAADPVLDHVHQRILLPDTLVLSVQERQPFATLAVGDTFLLLDDKGVPYRTLDAPSDGFPLIVWDGGRQPVLGQRITQRWLQPTYDLLTLLPDNASQGPQKITVDRMGNMCLNRSDVRIFLGQPDELAQKMRLAQAALSADGGEIARRAAYIDVSCPERPVWMPRPMQTGRAVRPVSYQVSPPSDDQTQ